jgi:rubrerythrin
MMAEKALKDLHNAMLDRKYSEAWECGMDAIRQVTNALHAIIEMERYEQTSRRPVADYSTCQPPKGQQ